MHFHAFKTLQINATEPDDFNPHSHTHNLRRFIILYEYYHLRHALQNELFIRLSLKSSVT